MKRTLLLFAVLAVVSLGQTWAQELNNESITIEGYGWMSYVPQKNLYFNSSYSSGAGAPDDTHWYAFKAVATDKDNVYLKSVAVVQAGAPIWIWGTNTTQNIQAFDDFDVISISPYQIITDFDLHAGEGADGNLFRGSRTENVYKIQSGDYFLSSKDAYVHAANESMIDKYLPAGKVLLRTGISGGAKLRMTLLDDDDPAEAIDAVCTDKGELIMYDPSLPSYNAAGQLVPGDAKGLHIQKGYKFYIK